MRMLRIALLCAATRAATSRKALADGCARVYVDYGSNAGIQVRRSRRSTARACTPAPSRAHGVL